MKKILFCSMVVAIVLLMGLNAALVSAVSLPEIPKPSIPSVPSVPSIPVPGKPAAVGTVPAKPAAVGTAPVAGTAGVEQRFKNQDKRINDGIKSGKLTPSEASALRDNLNYIKGEEARLKADGRLDKTEQQRINKMLDQNSNMIENKKNNPIKVMKDSRIEERFQSQQERIDRGIAAGTLTKDEVKIVQGNLDKIKAEESRLRKEGKFTTEDKNRLDKMLDQNSDMIQDKAKNPVKKM